jgi:hypothetical protein
MGALPNLGDEIAAAVSRGRIDACGRHADEAPLCQTAVNEIRGLVLDAGGVTEEEAELLLVVIRRLTKIQSRDGVEAARKAAQAVRQTWVEMSDEDDGAG